jgi:hypothetical protein
VNIERKVYDEIVRRLVSLRRLAEELSQAYDDPVAKKGAEEMRVSLDRILQLLEHQQ